MRTAVIGGGTMGVGIAHAFAINGSKVTIVDADVERARSAVARVLEVLDGGVARGKLAQQQRDASASNLSTSASIDALERDLDLIVEAVPERLELKRDVLAAAERREPRMLVTNTSGISIDRLAEALRVRDRFIGLHFFNPVWSMQLVEIVVGSATSDATRDGALAICREIDKEPVVVRDSPGFASTRLSIAIGLEAIRMVEEGVASVEDIDRAMELGYRHPMGPLRLADLVGLDVRLDIARNLTEAYGARYAPPRLLIEKVAKGELGKKAGIGFYRWP